MILWPTCRESPVSNLNYRESHHLQCHSRLRCPRSRRCCSYFPPRTYSSPQPGHCPLLRQQSSTHRTRRRHFGHLHWSRHRRCAAAKDHGVRALRERAIRRRNKREAARRGAAAASRGLCLPPAAALLELDDANGHRICPRHRCSRVTARHLSRLTSQTRRLRPSF